MLQFFFSILENLKQQILPKDELISDLRSQIDAMEDELNAVTKTQAELHTTIEETRSKHNSATQELSQERKKATTLSVLQVCFHFLFTFTNFVYIFFYIYCFAGQTV